MKVVAVGAVRPTDDGRFVASVKLDVGPTPNEVDSLSAWLRSSAGDVEVASHDDRRLELVAPSTASLDRSISQLITSDVLFEVAEPPAVESAPDAPVDVDRSSVREARQRLRGNDY